MGLWLRVHKETLWKVSYQQNNLLVTKRGRRRQRRQPWSWILPSATWHWKQITNFRPQSGFPPSPGKWVPPSLPQGSRDLEHHVHPQTTPPCARTAARHCCGGRGEQSLSLMVCSSCSEALLASSQVLWTRGKNMSNYFFSIWKVKKTHPNPKVW